ncbi:putative membrane protein (TIGR02234 family) [Microbacterium halimionae]|uniref:Putative membrane protein (TIGR02234 family) n=1 Tax=Microbacterium halimionae TaxID=1526413 RepID=A0A7W3PLN9_9MICO|nr:Trp biosynthesis-associated membrane protein [Microbacterium halimionae]MBA8816147.1 putative membrane protein (TIGR02234 family) [Microbacterium halimionae]NII96349.1 putative membrane protein (TIGR02234 family) [Microbacterium halimionae]
MTARARLISVLAVLSAGALGIISSTQTWLSVTVADGSSSSLPVSGAATIPVLAPLSLAVLAAGAALSIIGLVLRYIFGVLTLVIAGGLSYATAQVAFAPPVTAVSSTVTEATGISGIDAITDLVSDIVVTPWPFISLLAWIILIFGSIFMLFTARRWNRGGRRYDTAARREVDDGKPLDSIDSWDGLSRGDDPTAPGDAR